MNRRNIFAVAATVVGLSVIPVAAQKAHQRFGGGNMQEHFLNHISSALSLTDAQKATAQELFTATKTQAEPLMQQMKQNRTDMQAAIKSNNTAQISALAARQGQLSGQLAELHGKAMASFYAQLTPEQRVKADELHSHLEGRMHRRFGGMRHHEGGPSPQAQ